MDYLYTTDARGIGRAARFSSSDRGKNGLILFLGGMDFLREQEQADFQPECMLVVLLYFSEKADILLSDR